MLDDRLKFASYLLLALLAACSDPGGHPDAGPAADAEVQSDGGSPDAVVEPSMLCGQRAPVRILTLDRTERLRPLLFLDGYSIVAVVQLPASAEVTSVAELWRLGPCGEDPRLLHDHVTDVGVTPGGSLWVYDGDRLAVMDVETAKIHTVIEGAYSYFMEPVPIDGSLLVFDETSPGRARMLRVADPIDPAVPPELVAESVDAWAVVALDSGLVLARTGEPQRTGSAERLLVIDPASGHIEELAIGIARFHVSPNEQSVLFEEATSGALHVRNLNSGRIVDLGRATSSIFDPPYGEIHWTGDSAVVLEYFDFNEISQAWNASTGEALMPPMEVDGMRFSDGSVGVKAPIDSMTARLLRWIPLSGMRLPLADVVNARDPLEDLGDAVAILRTTETSEWQSGALWRVPFDGGAPVMEAERVGADYQRVGGRLLSVVDFETHSYPTGLVEGHSTMFSVGNLMLDDALLAADAVRHPITVRDEVVFFHVNDDVGDATGLYATPLR